MEEDKNSSDSNKRGPSLGYSDISPKRAMWQEIANKQNGIFKISMTSGKEIETHNISIPYKKWNIEISNSDTRPLKFQISFQTCLDFDLTISWEDFIDRIGKVFGKHDIELGLMEFDKHYQVQSNRPELVKEIITTNIQKTFLKYNVCSLSFQAANNNKGAELISVIERNAGTKDMILELIDTFKLLIDNIVKMRITEKQGLKL